MRDRAGDAPCQTGRQRTHGVGGGAVLNDSPVGCQTRTVTEPQRVAEGGGAGVNDCRWQSEPRRDRAAARRGLPLPRISRPPSVGDDAHIVPILLDDAHIVPRIPRPPYTPQEYIMRIAYIMRPKAVYHIAARQYIISHLPSPVRKRREGKVFFGRGKPLPYGDGGRARLHRPQAVIRRGRRLDDPRVQSLPLSGSRRQQRGRGKPLPLKTDDQEQITHTGTNAFAGRSKAGIRLPGFAGHSALENR